MADPTPMMIPPTIRVGPPPPASTMSPKLGLVVLTRSGWHMTKWNPRGSILLDEDAVTIHTRYISPHEVLCWMPEDGS